MLTPKEFFLWLEGYTDNMNSTLPSASDWVAIKRKMVKVDYEKESSTEIVSEFLDQDEDDDAEIGNESMTALFGIFPDCENDFRGQPRPEHLN